MSREQNVITAMLELVDLFAKHCSDRSTLDELRQMLPEHSRWPNAHNLFDRIRRKTLRSIEQRNHILMAQYGFEEICAKTIFNLTHSDAPFDADSPYYVIPLALNLARALNLSDTEVLEVIAPR